MDLYPRCMIKIEHETYKCSIGKFNKIIVKDENLPIVCHMCPLARELYSTPLVEGKNIEDNKENKINIQYPSTIGLVKNFSKAMINYAKSDCNGSPFMISLELRPNLVIMRTSCSYVQLLASSSTIKELCQFLPRA